MAARTDAVFRLSALLAEKREPFVVATVVWRRHPTSGQPGMKAVITADGELEGWLGGACTEPAVVEEALRVLKRGRPGLLCLGPDEAFPAGADDEARTVKPNTCSGGGSLEVFLEPHLPNPQLVAVGGAPVVTTLVSLARLVGFDAVVADREGRPRDKSAEAPAPHPDGGADAPRPDLGEVRVDPRSFVVVATMGRFDEDALEQALGTEAPYIALVASRKRGAAVLAELRRRGHPEAEIERIRSPAGLNLGPIPHEEIAVAIFAEIVQLKAQGLGAFGASASGAGETLCDPAASRTGPEQAVDPVCKMTVETGEAAYQSDHGGTTYYFCCAGCRQRFEGAPESFL